MSSLLVLQNNTALNPAGTARMDLQPGDRIIVRKIDDPTLAVAAIADAFARPRIRFVRKYGEPVQGATRGAVDPGATSAIGNAASPWLVEIDLEQSSEIICPDYCSVDVYYPGVATTFRCAYQFAVLPPPATEYYESVSVRPGPRDYTLSQRVASAATVLPPFLSPFFRVMSDTAGGPIMATWNFGGGLSDGPWAVSIDTPIYWRGANSIDLRTGAGASIQITHTVRF